MRNLVLANGHFHTFNPSSPIAESAVIADGKFIAVGDSDEILVKYKSDAKVFDLQHMHVYPGITDAHIHLLDYGMSLSRVQCEADTRQECLDAVQARAEVTEPGKWVMGHGWNQNIWQPGVETKELLDKFSPQNPIYLTHKSLHSAWVNSSALSAAGISKTTNDPVNGRIERDESGNPTGILYEGAMKLVVDSTPQPSPEERIDALELSRKYLNAFGITSVHDFDSWECYESLKELEAANRLTLRTMKSIPYEKLDSVIKSGLKSDVGSDTLRISWLKLFSDGALGPQTAAMHAPYETLNTIGMLFLDSEEIIHIGQKAMANGISTAIHAIGDRANYEVINGYTRLCDKGFFDMTSLPPRIEHVQIIDPEDMARMAKIHVTASMQPIHAISDRFMAEKYWGARCENAYAWKSVLTAGNQIVFGSDAPVESPNPFWGLYAALTRLQLNNNGEETSWYPDQCLSPEEALFAYIRSPHLSSSWRNCLGMIMPGFMADLFIIPSDLLHIEPELIKDMKPSRTMFAGEWI